MPCPFCRSAASKEQAKKTTLGYRTFWCSSCRRSFNECTGTPFNRLTYQTDLVFLVVLWRLRYLYRAIDHDGNLVDSLLSQTRDMAARVPACGWRFFGQAAEAVGHLPEKVTTDGHDTYPRATRETLEPGVTHRCSKYLNNKVDHDHRGIEGRYAPMRGFGDFGSAARFCTAHDEVRDHLRRRTRMREVVPPEIRREQFRVRSEGLRALSRAA